MSYGLAYGLKRLRLSRGESLSQRQMDAYFAHSAGCATTCAP